MEMKLSEIADVLSGYSYRGKIEPYEGGGIRLVQIKDLSGGEEINHASLVEIEKPGKYEKYLLKNGDIVMPVRGGRYPAVLFHEGDMPVIAPSHVFIIRCHDGVDPSFLCWTLNQAKVQHNLEHLQTGSGIRMLKKAVIEGLKIDVPPSAVQKQVALIQDKWREQKRTYEALIDNGNLLAQALCEEQLKSCK
jgi:restriction endonuclease S subunit